MARQDVGQGGIPHKNTCDDVELFHRLALYDTTHDYRSLFPDTESSLFDTVLKNIAEVFIPCEHTGPLRETDVETKAFERVFGIPYTGLISDTRNDGSALHINEPPITKNTSTGYRYTIAAIDPPTNCKDFYAFLNRQTGVPNHAFVVDTDFLHLPEILLTGGGGDLGTFYWLLPRELLCDSATKVNIHKKRGGAGQAQQQRIKICDDIDPKPITYTPFVLKQQNNYRNDFFSTVLIDIKLGTKGAKHRSPVQFFTLGRYEKIVDNPKSVNTIYKTREKFLLHPSDTQNDLFYTYIPFIQKRSGDWLQALASLDKTRQYTYSIPDDTSFILVTNDIVFLSYALSIGVNVLFEKHKDASNKTPTFLYFHNTTIAENDTQTIYLYDTFIKEDVFNKFKRIVEDFETLIIPETMKQIGVLRERYMEIQTHADLLRTPAYLNEAFQKMLKAILIYKRYSIFFTKYKHVIQNRDRINSVIQKIATKTRLTVDEIDIAGELRDFVQFFSTEHIRTVYLGSIEKRASLFDDSMDLYSNDRTIVLEPYIYMFLYMLESEIERPFVKSFLQTLRDLKGLTRRPVYKNITALFNTSFVLKNALVDAIDDDDDDDDDVSAASPPPVVVAASPVAPPASPVVAPPPSVAPPVVAPPPSVASPVVAPPVVAPASPVVAPPVVAPPVVAPPVLNAAPPPVINAEPTEPDIETNLALRLNKLWKNRSNTPILPRQDEPTPMNVQEPNRINVPNIVKPNAIKPPTKTLKRKRLHSPNNMNQLTNAFKAIQINKRRRINTNKTKKNTTNTLLNKFTKLQFGGGGSESLRHEEIQRIFASIQLQRTDPSLYKAINYIHLGDTQVFINIYDSMKYTIREYFMSYERILTHNDLFHAFLLFDFSEYIEQEYPDYVQFLPHIKTISRDEFLRVLKLADFSNYGDSFVFPPMSSTKNRFATTRSKRPIAVQARGGRRTTRTCRLRQRQRQRGRRV